jgi:hypothetical protein
MDNISIFLPKRKISIWSRWNFVENRRFPSQIKLKFFPNGQSPSLFHPLRQLTSRLGWTKILFHYEIWDGLFSSWKVEMNQRIDAAWGGPSGFKMKSIRKIITVNYKLCSYLFTYTYTFLCGSYLYTPEHFWSPKLLTSLSSIAVFKWHHTKYLQIFDK